MTAEERLKVAVIEPVGGHGGMNYYDIGLCKGLGTAGLDVTLYTCDTNPPLGIKGIFNVCPTFKRVFGSDPAWIRGIRYVRALVGALLSEKLARTKIVHFHFFYVGLLEFLGVLLARLLAFRVVVTAHDVESFKAELSVKGLIRRTYSMVNMVIAHNRTSAQEVSLKLGVEADRIRVVPHGSYVDFVESLIPRDKAMRSIGISGKDEQVILFFGQIKEVKGLDILIKAFASIATDFPRARLVIAGRVWKDDFSKYHSLIQKNGIADRVKLHIRYIADEEVSTFYSAADVVVLPYRRIYQSGVLLMAMSYGVPVLTSDLDAMREIVTDGVNGYLFKSEDSDDLAKSLRRTLSDANSRNSIARNALLKMNDEFNWLSIGKRLADVYRAIF